MISLPFFPRTYILTNYRLKKQDGKKSPPKGKKDRIDFVYFTHGDRTHLSPRKVEIFHDWDLPIKDHAFKKKFNKIEVSDHYPVYVEFDVN